MAEESLVARRLSGSASFSDARRWARFVLSVTFLLTSLVASSTDRSVPMSSACPKACSCGHELVNCSGAALDRIPIIPDTFIKTLILDVNYIYYIGRDSLGLSNRSDIESLTIRSNNLSRIDPEAFQRLTNLRNLHLDANRISFLHSTVFENISHLEILSLSNNPIGATELDWSFLRPVVSLRSLDVSGTLIGSLHRLPLAFSSLEAIEELTMQNLVLNMTNGYFENIERSEIRTLDFSISDIENVEEEAFLHLEQLRSLILANVVASSKSCENIFFGLANSSLEKINMQGVFIYDEYPVEVSLFHHLNQAKVRELNFGGNYVGLRGRVPTKLFHPLKSLRKLHLDDCDLVSIREETFHGLHDLKVLTLRRNLLSCVRGSDCGFLSPPSPSRPTRHPLRHLESIDLSDNLISESENKIQFNASFPALVSLNLRRNRLRTIPVGMFGDLKKLKRLDLSENTIETIEPEAFSLLEALTHLDLDGSRQLSRIRQDVFAGLGQLTHLSIRNSGLVHIHHAAFINLSRLEELRLRNNQLGQEHGAITKVIIPKSKLKILDIGENDLRSFPRGLLSNSFYLRRLLLDSNRISNCHSFVKSPEALPQLEVLDLSYNSLVDPSKSCFESLRNLKTIDLSFNPFYCSCGTQDLSSWLQQTHLSTPLEADYVCASPDSLTGSSIFQLELSGFDCHWRYGVVSGLLVGLLVAAVVVILVLCFRPTRNATSRANCTGSSSTANSSIEAAVPGCSMFGKSAPYVPLDEEELATRGGEGGGGMDDHDQTEEEAAAAAADGFCRTERAALSGSFRNGAATARQSASSKKSSKCNGFSRAKTRTQLQSAASPDDAAMQTCALVEETSSTSRGGVGFSAGGGCDDLSRASPRFLAACNSDTDHIEDAV